MPSSLASIPFKRPLPTASTSAASTSTATPSIRKGNKVTEKRRRIVDSDTGEASSDDETAEVREERASHPGSEASPRQKPKPDTPAETRRIRSDGARPRLKKKQEKAVESPPASELDELASDSDLQEEAAAREKREKKARRKARKRAKREEKQRRVAKVERSEAQSGEPASTEGSSTRTTMSAPNPSTTVSIGGRQSPPTDMINTRRAIGKFAVSDDDEEEEEQEDGDGGLQEDNTKTLEPLSKPDAEVNSKPPAPEIQAGPRPAVPVVPCDPTSRLIARLPPTSTAPTQTNTLPITPQHPLALPSSSSPRHIPRDVEPFVTTPSRSEPQSPVEKSRNRDSTDGRLATNGLPVELSRRNSQNGLPPSPVHSAASPFGPDRRSASPLALSTLNHPYPDHSSSAARATIAQSHARDRRPNQLSRSISIAPQDSTISLEPAREVEDRERPSLSDGEQRHPPDGILICEGKDQTNIAAFSAAHESVVVEQAFAFERRGDLLRRIDFDMTSRDSRDRSSTTATTTATGPHPNPVRARLVFRTLEKEANVHNWPILFQVRLNDLPVRGYNKLAGKLILSYQALEVTSLLKESDAGVNTITLARWPQDLLPPSLSVALELFTVVARASLI